MSEDTALIDQLFEQIVLARQRVYRVRPPTPLERLETSLPFELWVKREDQPPIHAYKWRGAFNRMATLSEEERARGVVSASAGNHAQGVALAARILGCKARIYMPLPTPAMKREAVARHGGDAVEVILVGDTFDEASAAARKASADDGLTYVHPFNDLQTIAGQGTIGDEIVMSGHGPFDVVILPIGGGGLIAGIATYLKRFWPDVQIIGVEGEGQASMAAAVAAGHPVPLDKLDIFCDGTAVREVGALTHALCSQLVDRFVTVSNDAVCSAIRGFWDARRRIVEPAGALGMAAAQKLSAELVGKRVLTITCGANMDFSQLAVIAAEAGLGEAVRRHVRFEVPERSGGLLGLLERCLSDVSINDFQYGKTEEAIGRPVLGFDATDAQLDVLMGRAQAAGHAPEVATHDADVAFRAIPFRPDLARSPLFVRLDFPERAGALRDFLHLIRDVASIAYFNYHYTGERLGRALLGLEFDVADGPAQFERAMASSDRFRDAWAPLDAAAASRLLTGRGPAPS